MSSWPHAGDNAVTRARRVAQAYRERLREVAPDACAGMDDRMRQLGQTWIVPEKLAHELDDLVTTAVAAELAGVEQRTVHAWRRRGYLSDSGQRRYLVATGQDARGWPLFRVGDVLKVAATTRRRRTACRPPSS